LLYTFLDGKHQEKEAGAERNHHKDLSEKEDQGWQEDQENQCDEYRIYVG
jgi:hypothetical protein